MKKILMIGTILLLAAACNKDFDAPNPNAPTIASFWKTESDAVKGVNAVYSTFHRGPSLFSRWLYYHGMLKADEGFGSGGDIGLNNLMNFVQTNYNDGLTALTWETLFVGVFRANQALYYIPQMNINDALKARLIGEAKFLRGLFYFYLTLYFGRPPLMLTPSQPTDVPPNATTEQAWAQVAKDLTEAAAALPVSYPAAELGRATKGAAFALLGKAYLQQKKYQEAADALAWLVTGDGKSVYSLMPNYRDNFVIDKENNAESVFEIQFTLKPNENTDDDVDETRNPNPGTSIPQFYAPPGVGFNDGAARRRWLLDTFLLERTATGARDPRLEASFIFDSTDVRGPDFTMVYGRTFTDRVNDTRNPIPRGGMWFRKLQNDHWKNFEGFNSPNNFRMIRYADVLLMYAEALNGLNRTAEAYPFVDRVRQRVGMAPLAVIRPAMNQAQFLAQLKHERIVELSGEGWRWADLARWGDLGPGLQARDPEFRNFVVGKHELYPIPQGDIDLNPNLTQNPNY